MIKFIVIALATYMLSGCHAESYSLGACLMQAEKKGLPDSVCYPKLSSSTPSTEHLRHQMAVIAATQPLPILQQVVAKDEQVPKAQAETSKMINGVPSGRYQMTIAKVSVYRITENGKTTCKIVELGEVPCAKFKWPKQ